MDPRDPRDPVSDLVLVLVLYTRGGARMILIPRNQNRDSLNHSWRQPACPTNHSWIIPGAYWLQQKMIQDLNHSSHLSQNHSWATLAPHREWFLNQNGLNHESKWNDSCIKIGHRMPPHGMIHESKWNDSWIKMEWFLNQNGMIHESKWDHPWIIPTGQW